MRPHCGLLICVLCALAGCTQKETAPWQWVELGAIPITEALDSGEGVAAMHPSSDDWPHIWWGQDTTLRIARRELTNMPGIACGDLMHLYTGDFPVSIRQVYGWGQSDSLLIRWRCLDRPALAQLGAAKTAAAPRPEESERHWFNALRQLEPDRIEWADRTYAEGDPVQLTIMAYRPDGSFFGDTVHMAFGAGAPDQVVPALLPFLNQAGPGASARVWSTSEMAFGSGAHPQWRLAPFTPVQFVVQAR